MIESNLVIPSRVMAPHDAKKRRRMHAGIRAAARERIRRIMAAPTWHWRYPTPPRA